MRATTTSSRTTPQRPPRTAANPAAHSNSLDLSHAAENVLTLAANRLRLPTASTLQFTPPTHAQIGARMQRTMEERTRRRRRRRLQNTTQFGLDPTDESGKQKFLLDTQNNEIVCYLFV